MGNIQKPKIGVIGNGSWGTAIVKMLCENNEKVNWWIYNEKTKAHVLAHKHNLNYLTSVEFDLDRLNITTDINEIVQKSDMLIFVVPSIHLKDTLSKLTVSLQDKMIFSAIKGIVPEDLKIVGSFLHDEYQIPYHQIGVITGPCHAEEVAMQRLSYLTIAAQEKEKAQSMADCLRCDYIKTTISDDIFGTEYAAVLKNIFAIAVGISHGLGYGDNFQAVLISNAIREMSYFLKNIHPMEREINDSAYLGDLLVTGYSFFSRNRMFGNMVGKGYTVKSAILEMRMVAEGYYATKGIQEIVKKNNLDTPICNAVYEILYEEKNAKLIFRALSDKLT